MKEKRIPWNKGLTKENDSRIRKIGISVSNSLKGNSNKKRIYSLDPNDWIIECEECGSDIVYSSYGGYANTKRRSKKQKIKCGTCRQLGRKFSKNTLLKMSKIKTGRKLTEDQIEKIRLGAIKRIENTVGNIYPNFNPVACKIIDEYGKENGYNFQHAENGGEICIGGYFPDGVDKKKKTIIEIDEKHHFDINGNLKQKDLKRQLYLENLGYRFIRIKI